MVVLLLTFMAGCTKVVYLPAETPPPPPPQIVVVECTEEVAPCPPSPSACSDDLAVKVFVDFPWYCQGEIVHITGSVFSLPDCTPCCGNFQIKIFIDGKLIRQVCTNADGSWQSSHSSLPLAIGWHTVRVEMNKDAAETNFFIKCCPQPQYYPEPSYPDCPDCPLGGPGERPE